jgi:hypothetical protein
MNRAPVEEAPAPAPTIWPLVVAAGIVLLAVGLVMHLSVWTGQAKWGFVVAGAAVLVLGIGGWIQNLRDEGRESHE